MTGRRDGVGDDSPGDGETGRGRGHEPTAGDGDGGGASDGTLPRPKGLDDDPPPREFESDPPPVAVTVENLGGIGACEVTVDPGVTVLVGRNATNRTSLLSAVAGALGGSDASLKTDADAGRVDLDAGAATYHRVYERTGGSVAVSGHPYVDDPTLVDTCVSLLEDNPARRAVERGGDLRDVLLGPLDTAAIESKIRERESELDAVRSRLERVDERREALPDLERKRRDLEDRLAEVKAEIAGEEAAIDEYEVTPEEAAAAEETLSELGDRRDRRRGLRERIATQETSVDALEREREDVELALSEVEVDPERLERVESELSRLRGEERRLTDAISDLAAIVEFNEDLLSGDPAALDELGDEDAHVTAPLDPATETVECWTCGSTVERSAIRERIDDLRAAVDRRRDQRAEVRERLSELRERKRSLRSSRERRRELESRRSEIDRELDRRRSTVEDLRSRVERLDDEIEKIEAELAETEALGSSDLLDHHRRVSELEYERGQVEAELSDVRSSIAEIEGLLDRREQLAARRSDLREELADLRNRVERTERAAVESFNDHAATLLDVLGYENVSRVWIERIDADPARFDLHVVRTTDDGTTYEDSVDTLSESERTVIGLLVALAGYLVHDVDQYVPFLLLDSLEAIDAERIDALLSYFSTHATYLLVALLPGDAAGVDERYDRLPADDIGE